MDPLSLTASLVTISGLAATSCKTIRKFKNAPKDVEELLELLRTFEALLQELMSQLQDHQANYSSPENLQQVWGHSLKQMERDMKRFHGLVSKVEPLTKTRTISTKFWFSLRHIMNEKEVAQYQGRIETHCSILASIQAMACRSVPCDTCESSMLMFIPKVESWSRTRYS